MGKYSHVVDELYMIRGELEKAFPDYEFSVAGSIARLNHLTRGAISSDARRIVFRKKGERFFDGYLPTEKIEARKLFLKNNDYTYLLYIKNVDSIDLEAFADNRKVLGY